MSDNNTLHIGQRHSAIQIVGFDFAYHLLDHNIPVILAAKREGCYERNLNRQVDCPVGGSGADGDNIVFLLNTQAGRGSLYAF